MNDIEREKFINKIKPLGVAGIESAFSKVCKDNEIEIIKYMLENENIKFANKKYAMAWHGFFNAAVNKDKELCDYYLYFPTLKENISLNQAMLVLINRGSLDALEFVLESYSVIITKEIEKELVQYRNADVAKFFALKELKNNLNKDLKEKDKQAKVKL